MRPVSLQSWICGALMCLGAIAAYALTPNQKMADARGEVHLQQVIPESFDDWKIDKSIVPIQVSPDVQARLDKVYDQTLSRTYVNSRGVRVMLSVAYGGDQSKSLQLHRPEVCYAAQGFTVSRAVPTLMSIAANHLEIRATRLVATLGARKEPITYWMRVGDDLVSDRLGQALIRYRYGLQGVIPDGVLFRVSTISSSAEEAYEVQKEFVEGLSRALSPDQRQFVFGLKPA